MTKLTYNQIEGSFPALDRKKLGKPFVMDGKNYLIDLDGPRSAFGYQCPHDSFTPHQFMQSFVVGGEIFYFARDINETITQISTVAWPSRQVIPQLTLTTDATRPKLNLPWTHAFVGTFHYFANRTAGIWQYDAINHIWTDITATIGIANIFFITESAGRLICLAQDITAWSAIDDGLDFTPSLITGAGFQALSLVGPLEFDTDYLGLQKTARGYLSFTRKGVLRSEIIDSINPFRHLPGESKQVPLTAWNVTKINATEVVILSRQGLFKTEDGFFKEWQPLQGEYFKNTEIPALQSQTNGFISIYYSQARDEFYVTFAQSEGVSQYTKAWTLYVKADKWGLFNRVFKGFVFIDPDADGIDFKQAYVDNDGHLCYLDDSVISLAIEPQNVHAIYVQPLLEYPTFQLDGIWIMPTNVHMSGFSNVGYPPITGWYEELGEQTCNKTEEVGEVKTAVVIPARGVRVLDTTLTNLGFLNAASTTPTPVIGINYQITFKARIITGDNIRLTFSLGAVLAVINFTPSIKVFQSSLLSNLAYVENADGSFTFTADWFSSASYVQIAFMRLYPSYPEVILRNEVFFGDLSVVDLANPAVEILPETDLTDAIAWQVSGAVKTYGTLFPTDVTVNGELCVLGPTAQAQSQIAADSFIEVGLFRLTDEEESDQFSLITNVAISCLDILDSTVGSFDDWLEDYATDVFEDWLTISPDVFEDWGLELAGGSVYTQKIRGSLDGYKTFEDQYVDIDEVLINGKTKFCSSANAGLFQAVEISALNVGEAYHVKTLELSGTLIGRL